jgi:hypothetical protein
VPCPAGRDSVSMINAMIIDHAYAHA